MSKCWLVAAVWMALGAAGCRKDPKSIQAEQLAALDNAYQSGVLTKSEYDAKRAALMGTPAQSSAAPPRQNPAPTNPTPSPAPVQTAPQVQPPATPPAHPPAVPAPQPPSEAAESEPAPLAGCADAIYRSGKEKGIRERFYPAPVDVVKRAAELSLKALDFSIQSSSGNEIDAQRRHHLSAIVGGGSERLILHFQPVRQGGAFGTLVSGETRKGFVGRVTQHSWTNALLAQIACYLRPGR